MRTLLSWTVSSGLVQGVRRFSSFDFLRPIKFKLIQVAGQVFRMGDPLRFDGKVVLVTGAGAGLGRAYALAFAERGASVVVNDLGGDIKGGGASSRPADKVVDEIRAKGGKAVANYNSVEDGEKVVQTALDNFGRIDILVNNAGILRDKSFARISDQDWDIVHRVHLRGSFLVTRAAWPHMKKQKYGRIILVTSTAGIYGNFGQANYSAAKLGLLGMSNTLAIEGKKYNIFSNTVAPTAGSRLTETVMPSDMLEALKPEYVAPLVVYLCHDSCEESGGLFECGAGWAAKLRWQKTQGAAFLRPGDKITPEAVRDNWEKITDFTDPTYPASIQESTVQIYKTLGALQSEPEEAPARSSSKAIDPELAVGAKGEPIKFTYTDRDTRLYALGVGVSTSQPDHLKFLYEHHEDFCTLPSYGVIVAFPANGTVMTGNVPGLQIDPTQILHGEQYLELYKPMPISGTLTSQATVADILDKGSGAVILLNVETTDEQGEKVCFNQNSVFIQRAGGFGGKRTSDKVIPTADVPKRAPDASVTEKTSVDQAALYRLSGDSNPLHLDPSFAAMGGFSEPILHGLCSFGYAVRHVLKTYCDNDVTKFKAVKVRFSKPVLPGQSLTTEMWKEGNRVYIRVKVAETGAVCLTGAYVDLHSASDAAVATTDAVEAANQSDVVFSEIERRVKEKPSLADQVNAVFAYNLTCPDGPSKWTVDMRKGKARVYRGEPEGVKAACTISMGEADFMKLIAGELNPQQAFFQGKLKIKGNIMLSQKMSKVFEENAKI